MARKGSSQAVWPWVSLGGTSRRYRNVITGDEISRERYDRYYGSLFKRGAKSFKQAAQTTPPELREARPARGRGSFRSRTERGRIKSIRPLVGRQSRNVVIPFDVYYDEDEGLLYEEAEDYRDEYEEAILAIHANPAVRAASIIVTVQPANGPERNNTVLRIEQKNSLAGYDEFLDTLAEKAYPGDHYTAVTFHLRFHEQFTRKKRKPIIGLTLPPGFRQRKIVGR